MCLDCFIFALARAGCSSARLEYTSGGRVVAGSNPVIPTKKILDNLMVIKDFFVKEVVLEPLLFYHV